MNFLDFRFPGLDTVRCAFSLRDSGASTGPYAKGNLSLEVGDDPLAVHDNRRALRQALGFSVWQELRQVHGHDVLMDLDEDALGGPIVTGDGLATAKPGHGLVIKTADCQALLLTETSGRFIAALHCGWRGNACHFPATGVGEFCARYALSPAQVMAVRGPSLGPGKSEFIHFEKEWDAAFRPFFKARTRTVDLWSLTRSQLVQAGLLPENIFSLDLCTASSAHFFSYRREKTTGRQVGVIWRQ